jgi:hypothetical protein
VCIGRVSQLPRAAIGIDKPKDVDTLDTWVLYTDKCLDGVDVPFWQCSRNQFLLRLSNLSEVVSDMVHMFYAPRERLNSRKFLDKYHRYQSWYKGLPDVLRLDDAAPPHVFTLQ